jgi:hypothetical protein
VRFSTHAVARSEPDHTNQALSGCVLIGRGHRPVAGSVKGSPHSDGPHLEKIVEHLVIPDMLMSLAPVVGGTLAVLAALIRLIGVIIERRRH